MKGYSWYEYVQWIMEDIIYYDSQFGIAYTRHLQSMQIT